MTGMGAVCCCLCNGMAWFAVTHTTMCAQQCVSCLGLGVCCRVCCLHSHLVQWAHVLDIKDAFEQLADTFYEGLLTRRAAAMLAWWRTWAQLRQEREQLQLDSCQHMEAFTASR